MTKRFIEELLSGICVVAVCVAVGAMMFTGWAEHPAERPVSGYAYMETIGGETA